MLREAIIAATDNMRKLYELSGGVKNDGEKGAFREFFIVSLIRPLMPRHFGVGSGVVVSSNEQQSRQTDVIIYDRRLLPPVLLAGDRGIFPIDSVLGVVEVKSTLKASHYGTLVDAARRFWPPSDNNPNGLPIATPGRNKDETGREETIWPLYGVFAYTTDAVRDELKRLEQKVPDHNNCIRLIGVLDKGVWSYESGDWKVYRDNNEGNNSVRFLVALLNRLEATSKSRGDYRLQDWLCM